MTIILVSAVVFACTFGGVLLGMTLRSIMPEHHLSEESKDAIQLGMGLIATLAALVLGLVIASAKSSYDTQDFSIKHVAAKILLLDRELAQYGPETNDMRGVLRHALILRVHEVWPEANLQGLEKEVSPDNTPQIEGMQSRIRRLAPQNDTQRAIQAQALDITSQIMEARWFVFGGVGNSIPLPFLIVVVFWLTVLFWGFGLFAPRNATVIAFMFVCALSVAGAVLLILEMDDPFRGMLKVSCAPLLYAIVQLGQ